MRVKSNAVWHSLPGVIAAYQPIAAPDPFAARQNIAHNGARFGVYTAMPGVAPTWKAAVGWSFDGISQYLNTNLIPSDGTWSYLLRFSGAQIDAVYQGIFGLSQAGKYVAFTTVDLTNTYGFYNGAAVLARSGSFPSGIIGMANRNAYENGVLVSSSIPAWSSAPTISIYLGAINGNAWQYNGYNTTSTCLIVSRTLSSSEMWLASRQMAYCHVNPDWNAWARRRMYFYAPSEISALVAMRRRQSDANRIGSRGAIE